MLNAQAAAAQDCLRQADQHHLTSTRVCIGLQDVAGSIQSTIGMLLAAKEGLADGQLIILTEHTSVHKHRFTIRGEGMPSNSC